MFCSWRGENIFPVLFAFFPVKRTQHDKQGYKYAKQTTPQKPFLPFQKDTVSNINIDFV